MLQKAEPRGETAKDPHAPQSCQPGRSQLLPFGKKNHSCSNKHSEPSGSADSAPRSSPSAFSHKVRWLPPPLKVVSLATERDAVATPNLSPPGHTTGRQTPEACCSRVGTICGIGACEVFLGASVIGYKEQEYRNSCRQSPSVH